MLKDTLIKATEAGAAELKRFFNGQFTITNKEGINNPVTEADYAAEKAIIQEISATFPDHFILSEETGSKQTNSPYKWIIDPIDGTINFSNGIPICCVSVGLEFEGELIMGAVYNPMMQEFFLAEKGKGATLNGTPIQVNQQSDILKSCLVTGFPYTYLDSENGPLQVFERFIRQGVAVRRLGSAAIDLCWVAAGRFAGFYEHRLQPWDSAAGVLMVTEAGGKVTGFDGEKHSIYNPAIVASNGIIHSNLLNTITPVVQ